MEKLYDESEMSLIYIAAMRTVAGNKINGSLLDEEREISPEELILANFYDPDRTKELGVSGGITWQTINLKDGSKARRLDCTAVDKYFKTKLGDREISKINELNWADILFDLGLRLLPGRLGSYNK